MGKDLELNDQVSRTIIKLHHLQREIIRKGKDIHMIPCNNQEMWVISEMIKAGSSIKQA